MHTVRSELCSSLDQLKFRFLYMEIFANLVKSARDEIGLVQVRARIGLRLKVKIYLFAH